MKQVMQNLRNGAIELHESIYPTVDDEYVLIKSLKSVISPGTERMLYEFSSAGLLKKARMQPEKVSQTMDKIKADGLIPTFKAVTQKLSEPTPLGYCNSGIVLEVGAGVEHVKEGDRVASNGHHGDIVKVPKHLVARIPETVSDEEAAFTVLGSIALHGIRLSRPSLGEQYAVFGMGLVGLITTQLLIANGCKVLAIDINQKRLEIAKKYGAKILNVSTGADPSMEAMNWTNGRGVDAALITASASDDTIVHQAAQSCMKRGRIILVGVVDLNLNRGDFYEKELTFQVSCSYVPGRYDEKYEHLGLDYPEAYVRWTEGRNFEAVLSAMESGNLNVSPLISHRFDVTEADSAYKAIQNDSSALGIVINYDDGTPLKSVAKQTQIETISLSFDKKMGAVIKDPQISIAGVIGTGTFAKSTILPNLEKGPVPIKYVCGTSDGMSAIRLAKQFGAKIAVTDHKTVLDDDEVDTIFILSRHEKHAPLVMDSLRLKKNVFVEKPLCVSLEELQEIKTIYSRFKPEKPPILFVGYNRRFSPHIEKIMELLESRRTPINMVFTINAGNVPSNHWTQLPQNGGRIIGEACHFIDLMIHLTGNLVCEVSAKNANPSNNSPIDNVTISLKFNDGSLGIVNYFSNGPKNYSKEKYEIFVEGKVITMDNFKVTRGYGFGNFKKFRTMTQDKGHKKEISEFLNKLKTQEILIPFEELENSTAASIHATESMKNGATVYLN